MNQKQLDLFRKAVGVRLLQEDLPEDIHSIISGLPEMTQATRELIKRLRQIKQALRSRDPAQKRIKDSLQEMIITQEFVLRTMKEHGTALTKWGRMVEQQMKQAAKADKAERAKAAKKNAAKESASASTQPLGGDA